MDCACVGRDTNFSSHPDVVALRRMIDELRPGVLYVRSKVSEGSEWRPDGVSVFAGDEHDEDLHEVAFALDI